MDAPNQIGSLNIDFDTLIWIGSACFILITLVSGAVWKVFKIRQADIDEAEHRRIKDKQYLERLITELKADLMKMIHDTEENFREDLKQNAAEDKESAIKLHERINDIRKDMTDNYKEYGNFKDVLYGKLLDIMVEATKSD